MLSVESYSGERVVLPRPALMLVTEGDPPPTDTVSKAVSGGVNVVQLRYRGDKVAFPRSPEIQIREDTNGRTLLIANGYSLFYFDALDWDGWHLPEVPSVNNYQSARVSMGPNRLVGRSVHSVARAREFEREGADYLIAGTVFKSPSHPDFEPQGLDYLRQVCEAVRIPVIAIGGITPENAPDCIGAGAAGVAVLSPIMRAENPRDVAVEYAKALGINTNGQRH